MASIALEEKINKIRQQNEEIRRRYEEVEEDKKNAAKINALVQMVPSTDWPERKEPPEFSNPPRPKKASKEKHEFAPQTDLKKGDGPPPDPKYNFLADSEREEGSMEQARENIGPRAPNKGPAIRGNFKKRGTCRDGMQKDNRIYKGNYREDYQPGYEAWRAERNRIDEDRISRQRTAEGNWRREWDNDKIHVADDPNKPSTRSTFGDFAKKDHKDFERRYYGNGGDYSNHNRGSHRPYRGATKHYHSTYENRSQNSYDQHKHNAQMSTKTPLSPTSPDDRMVIATDKSIKVTLNQASMSKGPVMSVKVNLPNIAGTGRVGPRQRTRVTYSQSDADTNPEVETFSRQKSFDEKSRGSYFGSQKNANVKRSNSQRMKKNEGGSESPYLPRKRDENNVSAPTDYDNEFRSGYPVKLYSASKSPRVAQTARLSGSDNSDSACSVQNDDNIILNNKFKELPLKQDESSSIQCEQNKNGSDTMIVADYEEKVENSMRIIDGEAPTVNPVEVKDCTEEIESTTPDMEFIEQQVIETAEEMLVENSGTEVLGTPSEISDSTEHQVKTETLVDDAVQDERAETVCNIVKVAEEECDLSCIATKETSTDSEIINVTINQNTNEEVLEENAVTNSNDMQPEVSPRENEKIELFPSPKEREEEKTIEPLKECDEQQITASPKNSEELQVSASPKESEEVVVSQSPRDGEKVQLCESVERSEELQASKSRRESEKEEISSSPKESEEPQISETPKESEEPRISEPLKESEEEEIIEPQKESEKQEMAASSKESEQLLSISNCDSNKDAAADVDDKSEAVEPESICSSEAETCAVIKSQEETDLLDLSTEIKVENQAIIEDSEIAPKRVLASVNTDDTVETANTERNGKVESQNEALETSNTPEENSIENS